MIRIKTFLLLLSITSIFALKADDNISLFNSWQLVCHSNLKSKTEDCKSLTHKPLVEINFSKNGECNGHTINRFQGAFKVVDNKIEITNLMITEINEYDSWCKSFFSDIKTMNTIKITNDTLILYNKDRYDALKFIMKK